METCGVEKRPDTALWCELADELQELFLDLQSAHLVQLRMQQQSSSGASNELTMALLLHEVAFELRPLHIKRAEALLSTFGAHQRFGLRIRDFVAAAHAVCRRHSAAFEAESILQHWGIGARVVLGFIAWLAAPAVACCSSVCSDFDNSSGSPSEHALGVASAAVADGALVYSLTSISISSGEGAYAQVAAVREPSHQKGQHEGEMPLFYPSTPAVPSLMPRAVSRTRFVLEITQNLVFSAVLPCCIFLHAASRLAASVSDGQHRGTSSGGSHHLAAQAKCFSHLALQLHVASLSPSSAAKQHTHEPIDESEPRNALWSWKLDGRRAVPVAIRALCARSSHLPARHGVFVEQQQHRHHHNRRNHAEKARLLLHQRSTLPVSRRPNARVVVVTNVDDDGSSSSSSSAAEVKLVSFGRRRASGSLERRMRTTLAHMRSGGRGGGGGAGLRRGLSEGAQPFFLVDDDVASEPRSDKLGPAAGSGDSDVLDDVIQLVPKSN